jgi:hypothetical protein
LTELERVAQEDDSETSWGERVARSAQMAAQKIQMRQQKQKREE